MACSRGQHRHEELVARLADAAATNVPLTTVIAEIVAHASVLATTTLGRLLVWLADAGNGRDLVEQALSELVAGDRVEEATWRAIGGGSRLTQEQRDRLLAALEVASQRFQQHTAVAPSRPPLGSVGERPRPLRPRRKRSSAA